jgi:hypothetical protein
MIKNLAIFSAFTALLSMYDMDILKFMKLYGRCEKMPYFNCNY